MRCPPECSLLVYINAFGLQTLTMSLGYAVESWVFSVVQWAYVGVRALASRSAGEELCAYTTLFCSSINLLGHAASSDFPQHPYFALQVSMTLFFSYMLLSGMDGWSASTSDIPSGSTLEDCPNLNVGWMFRRDQFGGSDYHLVTGGVTMAFQAMQVLVSGAAVTQGRVWPGHALGYACLCYLCTLFSLMFQGVLQTPCPKGVFLLLNVWEVNVSAFFAYLAAILFVWIAFEGVSFSGFSKFVSRTLGFAASVIAGVSVLYVSDGRGMLTMPLFLYILVSLLFCVTGIWPDPPPPQAQSHEERRTVRWIVPPSLPRPLVMDDLGKGLSKNKKRL